MRLIPDELWGALTVWMEARGEPFDGKVAVARVIRNRMAQHWYGRGDVIDIVLQPMQFSCWNSGDPNRRVAARLDDTDPAWTDSLKAWQESAHTEGGVAGATFYYNPSAVAKTPAWATPDKRVAIIGHHHFFAA